MVQELCAVYVCSLCLYVDHCCMDVKYQCSLKAAALCSVTGELTQGELYSAIKKQKEQTEADGSSTTHFSGEVHFYELVEDTKDGIWLVQVKAHSLLNLSVVND